MKHLSYILAFIGIVGFGVTLVVVVFTSPDPPLKSTPFVPDTARIHFPIKDTLR